MTKQQTLFINATDRVLNMHGTAFFPGSVIASALPPGPPWERFDYERHRRFGHGMVPAFFDLDRRVAEYHGDAARHPEV